MSTEIIKYEPETALQNLRAEILAKYAGASALAIASVEQFQLADAKLGEVKKAQKQWNGAEKDALKPLKDLTAKVKAYFDEPSRALEATEGALKNAILGWHRKVEEQRRAQQAELNRQAAEAAAKAKAELEKQAEVADLFGDADPAALREAAAKVEPMRLIVPEIKNTGGSSSVRGIPKWRIVNAELLPREYLIPDSARLSKECKAGYRPPPGVEYYEEDTIAGRAA